MHSFHLVVKLCLKVNISNTFHWWYSLRYVCAPLCLVLGIYGMEKNLEEWAPRVVLLLRHMLVTSRGPGFKCQDAVYDSCLQSWTFFRGGGGFQVLQFPPLPPPLIVKSSLGAGTFLPKLPASYLLWEIENKF